MIYACQVPRTPFEEKQKTLKQDVYGALKQAKRPIVILGRDTPKGVICDWIVPPLPSKACVVEDKFVDDDDAEPADLDDDNLESIDSDDKEVVEVPAAQAKAPAPVTKASAANKAITS